MEIKSLDRQEYDYFLLEYKYSTSERYRVNTVQTKQVMSLEFVREKLPKTLYFENNDTLFQEYWDNPEAYGIFDKDGNLCAVVEVAFEEWNNRMRLTQLLVYEPYRRKGFGKRLMDFAKSMARERDYRIIVVETQTNNVNAIDFYASQGFKFCGSNIFFYSNDDIGEDEVMLEMAYLV